jgi:hypothetical protein
MVTTHFRDENKKHPSFLSARFSLVGTMEVKFPRRYYQVKVVSRKREGQEFKIEQSEKPTERLLSDYGFLHHP